MFEPPRDWLPLSALPAIVTSGAAVVKKAPLPSPPPIAVPAKATVAVLPLASPLLPPWARLVLSVLSVTVTEPPSFQTPPPPATPRRLALTPPGRVRLSRPSRRWPPRPGWR
jgi:hypothetical protein